MTTPKLLHRLTFRQLEVFQAVYEQQSYSRAAERLALTQPAVSAQIRQLEHVLEQPLFKYSGKTLHVLPAADALASSTRGIFGQVSRLQMALSDLAGTLEGELNLAAVSTAQYVVPHLLARFRARYPNVQVSLRVCNRSQALARLAQQTDDLVIMARVPEDRGLVSMPILDNALIPVVWPGHPLLDMPAATLEDFAHHYVLMREPGSGVRSAFEAVAARQRVTLAHCIELGTNEAVKQGVMAQLGVSVLPRLAVRLEVQAGLLAELPLPGFPLRHSWCTVYPRERVPTPVTELFLGFVHEHLGELDAHFNTTPAPMPNHGVACLPIKT
ncbi:LysR family transcriptional regulator [Halomonas urumqiensis]|uniref:LysR family transcriptional regulator n=1 Tax=Halomonas urumqiensis TaxID=1684789 RepID=A0A2N7UFI0_9GAMM|nr:LysR family transcriptional regulator [Halomonas urumqiensis]PMR79219.1 LysR family transcriptional regulator [Halomonas urumqiensis]PTB03894.1 LysR family transcriptional regulator [Halomonas urumqiensis]GHE19865.1 transcriptional regulator [Halomonas urumqiensis]